MCELLNNLRFPKKIRKFHGNENLAVALENWTKLAIKLCNKTCISQFPKLVPEYFVNDCRSKSSWKKCLHQISIKSTVSKEDLVHWDLFNKENFIK